MARGPDFVKGATAAARPGGVRIPDAASPAGPDSALSRQAHCAGQAGPAVPLLVLQWAAGSHVTVP